LNRRSFLKGTVTGAAGAAPGTAAGYPFHGAHQAGVLTPGPAAKQAFACVAAFDCTAADRAGLAGLLRELTSRARFLTAGGTPPDLGVGQPPSDSDVRGPAIAANGLTVTLSVGSSLFDDRYGLAGAKPVKLTPMVTFPDDALTRHTRGGMQLRWKMAGYNSPPRPSGTSRNLLGFKDGTANPAGALAASWSGSMTRPSPRGRSAARTRWCG